MRTGPYYGPDDNNKVKFDDVVKPSVPSSYTMPQPWPTPSAGGSGGCQNSQPSQCPQMPPCCYPNMPNNCCPIQPHIYNQPNHYAPMPQQYSPYSMQPQPQGFPNYLKPPDTIPTAVTKTDPLLPQGNSKKDIPSAVLVHEDQPKKIIITPEKEVNDPPATAPEYPIKPPPYAPASPIETLEQEEKKEEEKKKSQARFYVQVVATTLHLIATIFLVVIMFSCKSSKFFKRTYSIEAFDYDTYRNSEIDLNTCDSAMSCYRQGIPWDNQYEVSNAYWNPYALLFVMECITFSFSVFYLSAKLTENSATIRFISLSLFAIGAIAYAMHYFYIGQSNALEFFIVMGVSGFAFLAVWYHQVEVDSWRKKFDKDKKVSTKSVVSSDGRTWNIPLHLAAPSNWNILNPAWRKAQQEKYDKYHVFDEIATRMRVTLRYIEYTCTAPLLYLAMLCLLTVGTPFWAALGGYICILGCCLYGIPLQIMHIFEQTSDKLNQLIVDRNISNPMKTTKGKPIINTSIISSAGQGSHAYMPVPTKEPPLLGKENKAFYVAHYNEGLKNDTQITGVDLIFGFLFMGKYRSVWSCQLHLLQMCWICLTGGLLILCYLGRTILVASFLPVYVTASLWILLIFYCSFAIVGTLMIMWDYVMWNVIDIVYDVMSMLVKVLIVFILSGGYWQYHADTC